MAEAATTLFRIGMYTSIKFPERRHRRFPDELHSQDSIPPIWLQIQPNRKKDEAIQGKRLSDTLTGLKISARSLDELVMETTR